VAEAVASADGVVEVQEAEEALADLEVEVLEEVVQEDRGNC
jgi:hypothetical protein